MARPRTFDEDQVVAAAARAFWRAGYEATSTEDLCAATGLGRSSIYNTFKSKHDLFGHALRHYMTERTAAAIRLLESDLPIQAKIRTLLWHTIDADAADPTGCLVVNSIVELAPRDPEIGALLRRDHDVRIAALRAALDAGRRAGEIDTDKDPLALAHFVVATISGMRVAARAGVDRTALEGIAATALTAL